MYCRKCGTLIPEGAKFCTKCGSKIENIEDNDINENNQSKEENKSAQQKQNDVVQADNDILQVDNNEQIDNTQKYDSDYTNTLNNKQDIDQNVANNNLIKKSNKKGKIILSVTLIILLVISVLMIVFRNNIKCAYYESLYNSANDVKNKENYAEKAFTSIQNETTKSMIKDSLVALGEKDAVSAEKKLENIKDKISMNDYKELACSIKSGKISKLCKDSEYAEALTELEQISDLGQDIRKDKNYDNIMLNVCAKLADKEVRGSKNLLMEEDNMYYEKLEDDSTFDDIIKIKNDKTNSSIKVSLYSYSNGKYTEVDTKTFNKSNSGQIQGIYTCDKINDNEKKALYMYYEGSTNIKSYNSDYCKGISVIGVNNQKLCIIANVMGNEDVKCDDFNNDDIYEIYSESTNDSGWFKVFFDGAVPQKIADENGQPVSDQQSIHQSSETINIKTSDYIFSYSNTSYLSDYNLENLDKNTLALARNEIFARHGYVFTQEPFVTYFKNKTWYTPNPNFKGEDSELNEYEIANYKKIQEWEAK